MSVDSIFADALVSGAPAEELATKLNLYGQLLGD